MGFYTDVIRERDRIDRELEKDAELCLKDSRGNSGPTEAFGGACPALKLILSRYGLAAKEVHGCRNITEMLDLTLDPLGLIYDRISLSEGAWKKRSDHMLAFLEDGKAVALILLSSATGMSARQREKRESSRIRPACRIPHT